ncbi:MAG: UDP-N-acetylmuramoyl-tripeptide--D-alanyl-D-alanine ligase [Fretibacterium sp.]|nr:UDP-N-acetylmuramoyl-tripeptide--D-alanyl-D-alanine ligase [Fretibacterium sp.]
MKEHLTLEEMFGLIGVSVPEAWRALPFPGHVATDNRYVEPGGAFVALEGERTDGHRYICRSSSGGQRPSETPTAVERGAGLIVVRRGKRPDGLTVPCVELEDPERDLARMASAYLERARTEGCLREVAAVTGSVGKTTTREALRCVLGKRFRLHASERSLNTRIGCTATVLAMPLDAELLLLEFGANKPGEIAELTELFPPDSALVTEVAPVHLEGFGTLEGVLRGKMEIAGSRRLRRFLFNADNPLLRERGRAFLPSGRGLPEGWSVGEGKADFQIQAPHFEMRDGLPAFAGKGLPVLAFHLGRGDLSASVEFQAGVWGTHMARPLAFAAALGNLLGMSLEECAAALRGFRALPGRGRVLSLKDGRFVVDDAYNANPLSLRASLETFVRLPMSRSEKMAVLGEMKELGPDAARYHRELEPLLDEVGNAVLVGALWREAFSAPDRPGRFFAGDWREAMELVKGLSWRGLLVKGSNSVGLQNVVRALCGEPEGRP